MENKESLTTIPSQITSNWISRRRFIKYSAAGIASLSGLDSFMPKFLAGQANPIEKENSLQGTRQWELDLWSTDTNMEIKGYASATSVNKGGEVDLFVTTNPAQSFTIKVFRIGWYGGAGGRLLTTIGPLNGTPQTVPAPDPSTGIIVCNWAKAHTLTIPTNWVTGQYLLKLINSKGFQNYILLTVRDDSSTADILYQSPVNTYQAYNPFGGKSLYSHNSTDLKPALKVSFDRPYTEDGGGLFLRWELGMVRFLEKNGYNLSYCTNIDIHSTPDMLSRFKAFLTVGHDEYWTRQMFDNLLAARDQGKHLAIFGGNTNYWQARFENSSSGNANRVLVCYKENYKNDPMYGVNNKLVTTLWREPLLNRPENLLLGTMFDSQFDWEQGYPYVVKNSDHWVYACTGFSDNDAVPGIVGYEWDNLNNNGFTPPGLVLLSASPVTDNTNTKSVANSSIYQAASGAWVFNAGTIYWVYGCDYNIYNTRNLVDKRIQLTTLNILNRFVGASSITMPDSASNTCLNIYGQLFNSIADFILKLTKKNP